MSQEIDKVVSKDEFGKVERMLEEEVAKVEKLIRRNALGHPVEDRNYYKMVRLQTMTKVMKWIEGEEPVETITKLIEIE